MINKNIIRTKEGFFCKGELHPFWKGDGVGRLALHCRLRRYLKKPKVCNYCHKRKPYDLANISGKYKIDFADWEWLCRKCHMKKDGRSNILRVINIGIPRHNKAVKQCSLTGQFIKAFRSATEAERELEISRKSISNVLHGYSKTAGGFIWKT